MLWIKVIIFVKEKAQLKDGELVSMARKKDQTAHAINKTTNQKSKHIWIATQIKTK